MNERERILELVKQGVISSEEGLVLLENMAGQDRLDRKQATENAVSKGDSASAKQVDNQDKADETRLQELAAVNSELAALRGNIDAISAQLKSVSAQKTADNEQVIVLNTLEDLKGLSQEQHDKRIDLKSRASALEEQEAGLGAQLEQLRSRLSTLKAKRLALMESAAEDAGSEASASTLFDDVGNTIGQATRQFGRLVKNSVGAVLDNIDWKEVNVRVPGLKSEQFEQSWLFDATDVTALDLKIANGDTKLLPWDQDKIGVDATIKLYGKMDEMTPSERFLARSTVEVKEGQFILHADNKRVAIDSTIHLPKKAYERIGLHVLNGNAALEELSSTDFALKTTNGKLNLSGLTGESMSATAVNGDVKISTTNVELVNLDTVNGDVSFDGSAEELSENTVNGTIRARLQKGFKRFSASSVHGNIKVAVPASVGLSGSVKTTFGAIKSRLSGLLLEESSKSVVVDRPGQPTGELKLSTVSGMVQLKDADSDPEEKE